MSRIIFVPQFPSHLRYQSWWIKTFRIEFAKYYDEVIGLGASYLLKKYDEEYSKDMFSPINQAIEFETCQINEYLNMDIRPDDTLFLADLSFPGMFSNVLYHRPCPKQFAFCHATSRNKYDYFAPIRKSKSKMEDLHAAMFDTVFFGSYYSYHKTKWKNGKVVYLPDSPTGLIFNTGEERTIPLVSVCRPNIQKVNKKVETYIEKNLGIKIYRENVNTWTEYSSLLSRSKVMISSSKEDTFNLTILDAVRCGCMPIVPYDMCFPEILHRWWRYRNKEELYVKLLDIFSKDYTITPEIICQDGIDNFYKNVCETMKGESNAL